MAIDEEQVLAEDEEQVLAEVRTDGWYQNKLILLTCFTAVLAIFLAFFSSIPDRWTYLASLSSVIFFFLSIWDNTNSRIVKMSNDFADKNEAMGKHLENINKAIGEHFIHVNKAVKYHVTNVNKTMHDHITNVNLALSLRELDAKIKRLSRLSKEHSIVKEYLFWLIDRQKTLLDLPYKGVVKALDPDYFGFASLVFNHAERSVRSTSLVDPYWYDSNECVRYIGNQVNNLIKKGKAYTRYFIVNPKRDTEERKVKTVEIIKNHCEKGFEIVVVHTENYEREFDAAVIDNGKFWTLAAVPKGGALNLPEPEITGCECFFKESTDNQFFIRNLEGYFSALENRVHKRFSSSNLSSINLAAVYS